MGKVKIVLFSVLFMVSTLFLSFYVHASEADAKEMLMSGYTECGVFFEVTSIEATQVNSRNVIGTERRTMTVVFHNVPHTFRIPETQPYHVTDHRNRLIFVGTLHFVPELSSATTYHNNPNVRTIHAVYSGTVLVYQVP